LAYFILIIVELVQIALTVLQLCMIVRAVMSWLPFDNESTLYRFVCSLTEPIILPVRSLLERSSVVQSMPLDISFLVTMILLTVIQAMLPTVNI
jgi:YggT family protein